jgi:hypothetical protein
MEVAAHAAGIGILASVFRLENQIPLNPPLQKGEVKGDFLGLLTYGGLPAMRLPRRYRSSQ